MQMDMNVIIIRKIRRRKFDNSKKLFFGSWRNGFRVNTIWFRSYTVREFARLQGFPDDFKFSGSDSKKYKQIGNAVAVPMGKWVGEQALKYFSQRGDKSVWKKMD